MKDKSWRLRLSYTLFLMVVYFGFFLSCALMPTLMATRVAAGGPITLTMLAGATIMVGLIAITGLYVSAAHRT